eukprot:6010746-Lingulodinium_polyedra.AAC.1
MPHPFGGAPSVHDHTDPVVSDSFKGLVLISQRDGRALPKVVGRRLSAQVRKRSCALPEEFRPGVGGDVAVWWTAVSVFQASEGARNVDMAATVLLSSLQC